MTRVLLAAATALALSACAGSPFIRVNPDLSEEIQRKQAETAANFYDRLGDRLIYCDINGNVALNAKVAPDAGLGSAAGIHCPAKPWNLSPDADVMKAAIRAAVEEALADYTEPVP